MSRTKLFKSVRINRYRWRPAAMRVPAVNQMIRWWTLRLHAARDLTRFYELDDPDRSTGLVWRVLDEWAPKGAGAARKLLDEAWRQHRGEIRFPLHQQFPRLAELAARIGLSDAEADVMTVLLVLASCEDMRQIISDTESGTVGINASQMLALLTGLPATDVQAALRRGGLLHRLELCDGSPHSGSVTQILPGESRFTALVEDPEAPLDPLLAEFFRPAPAPTLDAADFSHARRDLETLRALLATGDTPPPGTNVLIHGPPGSGKSELARLLGRLTGRTTYEVSAVDGDGDPHNDHGLRAGYSLAQQLLARTPDCLLIIDEADPMLEDEDSGFGFFGRRPARSGSRKGWLNQMLERASTPTIWVANRVEGIDQAQLRRMDYILPLGRMPEAARQRIALATAIDHGLPETWAREVARNEHLMPAHLDKVGRVIARLPDDTPPDARAQVARRTLTHLHRALGIHQPVRLDESPLGRWDPAWIVTRPGLEHIETTLRRGNLRACFHGPPGTGKTELARELSRRLERPLHVRRASDLLSMWVGGTERAIAEAFDRAADEDAILLIDEIDGFLANRAGAQRNWEVTQVNELLTQMEAFAGVLIATTNRLDALDPASIRRFDLKVGFEVPGVVQLEALGRALCERVGVDCPRAREVGTLHGLTAGDFAAVARQLGFVEGITPARVLEALRVEHALKPRQRAGVGFLQ
jgi:hypothetical protein